MAEILTAADRLELEQLNTGNMDAVALVTRPPNALSGVGVTRSEGGTRTLAPATVYAAEPCRVSPAYNAGTATVGDQPVALSRRRVSFAKGRDVQARDELLVTLAGGATLALEVVGPENGSYEVARVVLCKLKGAP